MYADLRFRESKPAGGDGCESEERVTEEVIRKGQYLMRKIEGMEIIHGEDHLGGERESCASNVRGDDLGRQS